MSQGSITLRISTVPGDKVYEFRNAERLAEIFFRVDGSSAGDLSYDAWILKSPPDRFTPSDVAAINRTMGARSKPERWDSITAAEPPQWLHALDPAWDLFDLDADAWQSQVCRTRIHDALDSLVGPYRSLSVATKILHIKRPALIPVCDSRVIELLELPWTSSMSIVEYGCAAIEHIRAQGRANAEQLSAIQAYLAVRGIKRTQVRILDAILWSCHPASWYFPFVELLEEWQASCHPTASQGGDDAQGI